MLLRNTLRRSVASKLTSDSTSRSSFASMYALNPSLASPLQAVGPIGATQAMIFAEVSKLMAEQGPQVEVSLNKIWLRSIEDSLQFMRQNPELSFLAVRDIVGKEPKAGKVLSFTGNITHKLGKEGLFSRMGAIVGQSDFSEDSHLGRPIPLHAKSVAFPSELRESKESKKVHVHGGKKGSLGTKVAGYFEDRGHDVTVSGRPDKSKPVSTDIADADVHVFVVKPDDVISAIDFIVPHIKPDATVISSAAGVPIEAVRRSLESRPDLDYMRVMIGLSLRLKLVYRPFASERDKEQIGDLFGDPDIIYVDSNRALESGTIGACYVGILPAAIDSIIKTVPQLRDMDPSESRQIAIQSLENLCYLVREKGNSFSDFRISTEEVGAVSKEIAQVLYEAREACWTANEKRMPQDQFESRGNISFFPKQPVIPMSIGAEPAKVTVLDDEPASSKAR